jgi:hypothetical protein
LRVERVFGIDKRRRTTRLLRLCNYLQGQRRLAGCLRPVNLDDPAFRYTADAQRNVQAYRTRAFLRFSSIFCCHPVGGNLHVIIYSILSEAQ